MHKIILQLLSFKIFTEYRFVHKKLIEKIIMSYTYIKVIFNDLHIKGTYNEKYVSQNVEIMERLKISDLKKIQEKSSLMNSKVTLIDL